ncbi:MAG: cobalt-precorrin hydrolase / cobalt-factor methyltransferase / precorrin-3B [Miltoncostaeaceae bacterium]|nr:cobalt-precorrin hydrolase / cobalt-factor methyltransferase / precorrin-3B [Miltoncostaeaceae bacterium]
MIALVAASERGRALAAHLEAVWPDARLEPGRPSEALPRAFADIGVDGIVCFLAVGATVRLLAPLLADKLRDPGVVAVDDAGRYAVALVGGHAGGANALARRVAAALGADPVITTASDALGLPALDTLGADLGFRLDPASDLAAVAAALVGGEAVALVSERRWPLGPLPDNLVRAGAAVGPAIVIDDRTMDLPRPGVRYFPPSLVVGVGSSTGVGAEEVLALVDEALAAGGLAAQSVGALATVDRRAREPGILAAAAERGWPLLTFPAERLAAVAVPTPSEVVRAAVGTPSVAEAAALLASDGGEMVVAKRRSAAATAAVARRPVRGRLALVSLGPGDEALIPPLAREALARAEVVMGLERYVDAVRGLLRPGTRVEVTPIGRERERARRAGAEAAAGGSVALVSGGDVGVFGMASPALEEGGLAGVEVTVVPGVTAATAAAALAGSPLGHDHCAISLSDLLTPWEAIRSRLEAAAAADLVVSLYNPRSRGRDWQLGAALDILRERRPADTPVALVTDAYRPGQRVVLSSLAAVDPAEAGMTSIVIVGSSATRMVEGRMVTPRGYAGRVEDAPLSRAPR